MSFFLSYVCCYACACIYIWVCLCARESQRCSLLLSTLSFKRGFLTEPGVYQLSLDWLICELKGFPMCFPVPRSQITSVPALLFGCLGSKHRSLCLYGKYFPMEPSPQILFNSDYSWGTSTDCYLLGQKEIKHSACVEN